LTGSIIDAPSSTGRGSLISAGQATTISDIVDSAPLLYWALLASP